MLHVPRVSALACAALILAGGPAAANGHGGGGGHGGGHGGGFHGGFHHGGGFHGGGFHHFHHGFRGFGGFGFGPYFGYPYYYPYYYDYDYPYPYRYPYPYSYDYYAPGAYVVPSPLYSVPTPGQCRAFNGDAVIAGTNEPFTGTACWQPDGTWHMMQ